MPPSQLGAYKMCHKISYQTQQNSKKMAPPHSLTTTLLFILFAFSSFKSSVSCGIAVYWGQIGNEGTLREACASNLYKYVNIRESLLVNLADPCNRAPSGIRASLSNEIRFCQNMGVKVLLSIGSEVCLSPNATAFANYLWNTFLAENSSAALDGIDFNIQYPMPTLYWADLARALAEYSTPERKIYLAAAPQCPYPDRNLDAAFRTGLFDYVWVRFYNNPMCDYSSGVDGVIRAWNVWSSSLQGHTQLFLGLPASPQTVGSGYIPPNEVREDILPVIRRSENYGGVMVWRRLYDRITGYSSQIHDAVCDANLKLPSDGLYPK